MTRGESDIPTSTALDADDYDPIDDLNVVFSHPSTLTSTTTVSRKLLAYQHGVDEELANLVEKQATSGSDSVTRIQAARAELATLLSKIEGLRERALQTERTITEMTADIKRLDNTKRNLTLSMTALKRLQMLTNAFEQLQALIRTRQYKDCAQLLQAVIQLMAHFKSYRGIDQIATLGRKIADLQWQLLEQVCEDFEGAFTRGEVLQKKGMLAEACQVVDALGENARGRLVTWYCNWSLKEYRQIFKANDEAGSLDNISRRFAWFNRTLKTYDIEHANIFPLHWKVNEMLANAFCVSTRDDFKSILQRSSGRTDGQGLQVELLLACLQETLDFEHSLEKRFVSDPRSSIDTISSSEEKPRGFGQAISEAFGPYLSLWIDAQDTHLLALIPNYCEQPLRSIDEEFSPQLVISSSTELFQFYRLTLSRCAKLSTGSRLFELSRIFGKYLDQYSQKVLFHSLAQRFGPQGPSIEDIILLLNTADYCSTTCSQLEEKIKLRIDEEYRDAVDLQSQADTFMGIAGAAVRALVKKVDIECESSWREMRNMGWSKHENVGDQSSYIGVLINRINGKVQEILRLIYKQQYARMFCDNLVETLTNAYVQNIVQCRPISEVGAEQMLVDFYVLKKAFADLPGLSGESTRAQAAYTKRVVQTTSRIDPLLKTLQVRPIPPEALVQAYLIHIGDSSEMNFRKILDLKGITKRQDQAQLVELFLAHRNNPGQKGHLVANSPLLTPLQLQGPLHASGSVAQTSGPSSTANESMNPHGLSSANAKFDPASFGSAILTAARDGVERLGTPVNAAVGSASASAIPSRVASPPRSSIDLQRLHATNINENLRSIGKFFRRDTSGFGRFGSTAKSEGSS